MARGHLDDLLAFPAVGPGHSFTKAAAKLGVSQSALSANLKLWRSHGKPQQALRACATKIFCHLIRNTS
jgi:DNA-binding transcriptional LysR family regulator